jgi:hypothetical protein
MVLLLTAVLLLTPVPLSNIAPAIAIALISLAYIEEDGLLLCFALLAAAVSIGGCVSGSLGNDRQRRPYQRHLVAIPDTLSMMSGRVRSCKAYGAHIGFETDPEQTTTPMPGEFRSLPNRRHGACGQNRAGPASRPAEP